VVADLRLPSHHLHFLDLGGLAVCDLALLPGGNKVLILAGPTMTSAGPCLLHHWRDAFSSDAPAAGVPPEITVHTLETLLWIADGAPGPGHNNPEQQLRLGAGCCTHLDGFLLPEEMG
jgi:hypothetical protein